MRRALSGIALVAVVVVVAVGAVFYVGLLGPTQPTATPTVFTPRPTDPPTERPTASPFGSPLVSTPSPQSPTPVASPTPLDTNVHASAIVVPNNSADLAMAVDGVVSTIYVHAKEQVIAGELLLKLDQTKYLSDIEVASASVSAADAQVNRATIALNELPTDAPSGDRETAQANLRLAEANLSVARSQLTAAQNALEQTELRAPISGTVAFVNVSPGEAVTAGQTILSIGDMSAWLIETTDLSELDVVRVVVGDRATVTFTALPGVTINGTVTDIQVRGTTRQGVVTFALTIKPDVYLPQLRWNMTANVSITPSG